MSLTREWRRRRPHRSGHAMYPLTLYRQIQQVRYSRCPAQPPTYLPTCCVATHSSGSADSADKGEQPLFSPKLRACLRARTVRAVEQQCPSNYTLKPSKACEALYSKMSDSLGNFNVYNIYDQCPASSSGAATSTGLAASKVS